MAVGPRQSQDGVFYAVFMVCGVAVNWEIAITASRLQVPHFLRLQPADEITRVPRTDPQRC